MRLLVSVRDGREAQAAVAGGADIVDAKEPAAGSLGAVAPGVLAAIRQAVPDGLGFSAALGEAECPGDVVRAFRAAVVPLTYLKLGFVGVADRRRVRDLLRQARAAAAPLPGRPSVVAVAYADWARTGSLPPGEMAELVAASEADGLLVDTAVKDGTTLFDLMRPEDLAGIGRALVGGGRVFALGGSLAVADIPRAGAVGATVFGVRTAACEGGRNGVVAASRVRALAAALGRLEALA